MAATIVQDFIVGKRAWEMAVWGRLTKFHRNPACILLACKLAAQCPIDSIRTGFLTQLVGSTPTLTTVINSNCWCRAGDVGQADSYLASLPANSLYELIITYNSSVNKCLLYQNSTSVFCA